MKSIVGRSCYAFARSCVAAAIICLFLGTGFLIGQDRPVRILSTEANQSLIKKVDPEYPEMAKRMKLAGVVEVEATISEAGLVENIKTIKGNPLLSGAAKRALKQWKFKPIQKQGRSVKAIVAYTFNFTG